MRKAILFGAMGAIVATGAHAGLMDMLGLGQKKEPATLAEACDTSEIKKVCPEIILGDMSMADCLIKNVKELSSQCATYVKKAAGEKLNAATAAMVDGGTTAESKSVADAQVSAAKTSAQKMKESLDAAKASAMDTAQAFKNLMQQ